MDSASALLLDEMQARGEIGDQEWEVPMAHGEIHHPSPAQEGQGMMQQTPSAGGHLSQVYEGSRPAAKEKVAPPKPSRLYSTRPGDLSLWKPAGEFTPQQWQQEQRRRQSEVDRLTNILLGQEQQRPRPTLHEHFLNEANERAIRDNVQHQSPPTDRVTQAPMGNGRTELSGGVQRNPQAATHSGYNRSEWHQQTPVHWEQARYQTPGQPNIGRADLYQGSGLSGLNFRSGANEWESRWSNQAVRPDWAARADRRSLQFEEMMRNAQPSLNVYRTPMIHQEQARAPAEAPHPMANSTWNQESYYRGNRDAPVVKIHEFPANTPQVDKARQWTQWCDLLDAILEQQRVFSQRDMATLLMTNVGDEVRLLAMNNGLFPRPSTVPPTFEFYTFLKMGIAQQFYNGADELAQVMELDNIMQDEGEPVAKYMDRLKAAADRCDLHSELLIRSKFITGLRDEDEKKWVAGSSNSLAEIVQKATRNETLKKLSSTKKRPALRVAEVEADVHQVDEMSPRVSNRSAEVHEVRRSSGNKKPFMKPSSGKKRPREQSPEKKECPKCGNIEHRHGSCPALNAKCHNCGRPGHFARMCRERSKSVRQVDNKSRDKVTEPDWK